MAILSKGRWRKVVFVAMFSAQVVAVVSSVPGPSVAAMIPEAITPQASCDTWATWIPTRSDPAIIMQIVSKAYIDVEKNFILLMERNSHFTRDHLYLMCLDDESKMAFEAIGIRCVPVSAFEFPSISALWRLRVRVVSCLIEHHQDVIMSDADALWLGDPLDYFNRPDVAKSSIVASRGSFPFDLGNKWGSTMCMGFVLFRATGTAMERFQDVMKRIVSETGDDQKAVNRAAEELGIVWDESSDMRYKKSTDIGVGTITDRAGSGENFTVSLLPHSQFTRICSATPISNATTVAHCYTDKNAPAKTSWMKEEHLWLLGESDP